MKPLVVIVDDEQGILTTLSHVLEDEGFRTITTRSGEEALQLYRKRRPGAGFLGIRVPGPGRLRARQRVRGVDAHRPPGKASDPPRQYLPPPGLPLLQATDTPQRTIRDSTVIYGLGLHSGSRTGMTMPPLPPHSGIPFLKLPKGTKIH